jgi:hypothetical protein
VKRASLRRVAIVCAVATAAVVLSQASRAAGLSAPVADCNTHAELTHHYSIAELRGALATMPADIKEYTNCSDVIQRALLAELGGLRGSGGAGSGGGSFLPTPLIVVLALLVVAGAGFGVYAWRRSG